MVRGDYDCAKALFHNQSRPLLGLYFKEHMPGNIDFKIIASSTKCTIYTMSRQKVKMMPEQLRIAMMDGFFKKIKDDKFNAQ